MDDVFSVIAEHSTHRDKETIGTLSTDIRRNTKDQIDTCRDTAHIRMVQKLKCYWCEDKRAHHESQGLLKSSLAFIKSSELNSHDILAMEDVSTSERMADIRDIKLMHYTCENGTVICITVGSLLEKMLYHPNRVRCFFSGCAHHLAIYVVSHDQITLPRCADGTFYSFGFAQRIGDVGDFESLPKLSWAQI